MLDIVHLKFSCFQISLALAMYTHGRDLKLYIRHITFQSN